MTTTRIDQRMKRKSVLANDLTSDGPVGTMTLEQYRRQGGTDGPAPVSRRGGSSAYVAD